MSITPDSWIKYYNSNDMKYHKAQAGKFFYCLEEKLKEFNSGLVNEISYKYDGGYLMSNGRPDCYSCKIYLPIYHDADKKKRNEKAGFAVEYNYDPTFGYARIISGTFKIKNGSNFFNEVKRILNNLTGLGCLAGAQVNEFKWHHSRVFSLEGKSLNTEIVEVDDCIVGLLDTVLEVAEAIRRDPQLKAQMDFVPTNK